MKNLYIVYPASLYSAALALLSELQRYDMDASLTGLNEPGDPASNTLEGMNRADLVIVVGDLSRGGEYAHAEKVLAKASKLPILPIKVENECFSCGGASPAGELYPLKANSFCVPASLISAIARKAAYEDPFVASRDDWELILNLVKTNALAASLAPPLLHSGSWLSSFRVISETSARQSNQVHLLRAIIIHVLRSLKSIHTFHPHVTAFLAIVDEELDTWGGQAGKDTSAFQRAWRQFQAVADNLNDEDAKRAPEICTIGLAGGLAGLRANALNFADGDTDVDFLDILHKELEFLGDGGELTFGERERTEWFVRRRDFEEVVLNAYFVDCERNNGLPTFIPQKCKDVITISSRGRVGELSKCFCTLYREVYEFSCALVSVGIEGSGEDIVPGSGFFTIASERMVRSANAAIMFLVDLLAEAVSTPER